jgi:transposase
MLVTATVPAALRVGIDCIRVVEDRGICPHLHSSRAAVPCSVCGADATRVHGRSRRCLADLPWQGCAVPLHLEARRFVCSVAACPRRNFAEPFPGLVALELAHFRGSCAVLILS